jgi:hypothetical protein
MPKNPSNKRQNAANTVDRVAQHEHCPCVAQLEADVLQLKRRLAVRAPDPLGDGIVKRTSADPFAHLPSADRKWFERRVKGKAKDD